jgi:hypothetical protein
MKWQVLVLAAWLPACSAMLGPVDTAQLPPGEFASPDPDIAAVNYAAAAFSDQSSTYGNPAAGAEAALAVEYIAGALNTQARWVGVDPEIKSDLLQARLSVRETLGVAPGAPSQAVVNALSVARRALQAGDKAGAEAALSGPVFTFKPAKTVELLGNLPYLQPVNAVTLKAEEAVSGVASSPGPTAGLGSL